MFKAKKSLQKKDLKAYSLSMMNPKLCQTTTRITTNQRKAFQITFLESHYKENSQIEFNTI